MLSVYFRMFAKMFLFAFGVFFIIFFVVYGYRYNKNVGFMQKNVYVEMKFWSDQEKISFGGKEYVSDNKLLRLYNIDSGCYDLKYGSLESKECLTESQSFYDVFIQSGDDRSLGNMLKISYEPVKGIFFREHTVGETTFANPIKNAFKYNEINFVQSDNKLFYCNDDFSICKHIKDVSGDIIGGNKNGLIFYSTGAGYTLVGLK